MAQLSQRVGWICRSCRPNVLKEITQSRQCARPFSSSAQHEKALATFTPTSSAELDAILHKFRQEIFLPSVVSEKHNKLMTKRSSHGVLTKSPGVTVSVRKSVPPSVQLKPEEEEEIIKLEPITTKFPFFQKFRELLEGLEQDTSAAAWDNLIPLFEGLKIAQRKAPRNYPERLARTANIVGDGRWNNLITAASMVEKTGVTLSNIRFTRELMRGAFSRALEHPGSAEPAKTVTNIVRLLESPDHHQFDDFLNTAGAFVHTDMRQDPIVLASKLAVSSLELLTKNNGKDHEGVVSRDIQKALALNAKTEHERLTPESLKDGYLIGMTRDIWHPRELNNQIMDMAVLYGGLALADKVDTQAYLSKSESINLSAALQKLLRSVTAKTDSLITKYQELKETSTEDRRGPALYKKTKETVKKY